MEHACIMPRKERIQDEVDAICDHCRGEPAAEKIKWINFCLNAIRSNGWSQVDCDEVEERARFRLGLPPQ